MNKTSAHIDNYRHFVTVNIPKLRTNVPKLRTLGFITLPLSWWVIIGLSAALALSGIAYKLQGSRLESAQKLIVQMEEAGRQAEIFAKVRDKENKERKEKADANHKRDIAKLRADIARLRKPTSGGSMSPNPSGSQCPKGQVCFDAAEYQRAHGEFATEARGLADEGSEIAVDLKTAQEWARSDTRN